MQSRSYVTYDVVDSLVNAWYEANSNGCVHDEATKNDEIVEVWARQSDNPESMIENYFTV